MDTPVDTPTPQPHRPQMIATPTEWADLPGDITIELAPSHPELGITQLAVIHRIRPGRTYAAWQWITVEALDHIDLTVLVGMMDYRIRPWLYPEFIRWPAFEPFPRLTRAWAQVQRRLHPIRYHHLATP